MSVLALVRPDLAGFGGYASARTAKVTGDVWLNANEAAWANPGDIDGSCRRYPEPQPRALLQALADLYGTAPERLLLGRGSDEAIDLLVRALCVPAQDGVLYTPPVFGMYAVSTRLQGARAIEVPLVDGEDGLLPDTDAVIDAALAGNAKLVFLCSPSNPGGRSVPLAQVGRVAAALAGRALLVVDEAYGEYADEPSATTLLARFDNLAVLRTLSKAHGLAAARIGTLIADAGLVALLRKLQAPYPVPAPCSVLALAGLTPAARAVTATRVETVRAERTRLCEALAKLPGVRRA
ncbi:MAG: aminotransferase class I/II-fold pyridoxal phosphate-dependent enzyme, partial [Lysobacteraceae bacterium]